MVDTFHPDEVAIEELFFSKKHYDRHPVAQARGVILLALAQRACIRFRIRRTSQNGGGRLWQRRKKADDGNDESILHLTKSSRPDDAADALALAICHGHSRNAIRYEGYLMFYYVEGTVALLKQGLAVIDCGGVGYACHASQNTIGKLKNRRPRAFVDISECPRGYFLNYTGLLTRRSSPASK